MASIKKTDSLQDRMINIIPSLWEAERVMTSLNLTTLDELRKAIEKATKIIKGDT